MDLINDFIHHIDYIINAENVNKNQNLEHIKKERLRTDILILLGNRQKRVCILTCRLLFAIKGVGNCTHYRRRKIELI